ncbi:MAG: hypothetical protein ICV54_19640 [Nostoc sp. C3-bin3]|nr:hypothetical protein [Nostoc sp. C3-bin3]
MSWLSSERAIPLLLSKRHAQIKQWVIELNALAESQAPSPSFRVGSRVRYLGKGTKRFGMTGTIKTIKDAIAEIWLDYSAKLSWDLRNLIASFGQLELIG